MRWEISAVLIECAELIRKLCPQARKHLDQLLQQVDVDVFYKARQANRFHDSLDYIIQYYKQVSEDNESRQQIAQKLLFLFGRYGEIHKEIGLTPLMHVTYISQGSTAQLLIKSGVNVNAQDNEGWTALMWACYYGNEALVRLLIEEQVQINLPDNDGMTALMIASDKGYKGVVQLLIKGGADINIQNNKGSTAMMLARKKGRKAIVRLFVKKDTPSLL